MAKALPKCNVDGYRAVEMEPAMEAAVHVFDAMEAVDDKWPSAKRVRGLLADALIDLKRAGIPVPIIETKE